MSRQKYWQSLDQIERSKHRTEGPALHTPAAAEVTVEHGDYPDLITSGLKVPKLESIFGIKEGTF